VQKLTINVTVTNKVHFYAGILLFVVREGRTGSTVVLAAIRDAADFDGESPFRIVSTHRCAGICLRRGKWVKNGVIKWKPKKRPINTVKDLELVC